MISVGAGIIKKKIKTGGGSKQKRIRAVRAEILQ
jgi:hypothetical protein